MTQIDPQFGVHRQEPIPTAEIISNAMSGPFYRAPTSQNPNANAGVMHDPTRPPYPKGDREPSRYAQGYPRGPGMARSDTSDIDYGVAPQRVPKLFKDATSAWDGASQHGSTQQNYRLQLFHLRPSYPTRGYRAISGIIANQGPTSSRVWIPAVVTPSGVA